MGKLIQNVSTSLVKHLHFNNLSTTVSCSAGGESTLKANVVNKLSLYSCTLMCFFFVFFFLVKIDVKNLNEG